MHFTIKKKGALINIVLLTYLQLVAAQSVSDKSGADKPNWTEEPPRSKYYHYYSGVGSSPNSLSDAKDQAIANVISEIIMAGQIRADSRINTLHIQSNQEIISRVSREVRQTGGTVLINNLTKEEEYWQSSNSSTGVLYQYWILMKIPKPEFAGLDINIKQGYGYSPVWRSILVPGWGQFYKGEPIKGRRILISEAILISTTLIAYYFSKHNSLKAESEREYENREFYNNWSTRFHAVGTVGGILASVIYGYNIFDAITSKGAKRYTHSRLRSIKTPSPVDDERAALYFSTSLNQ